ncbi:two pore domain potassium channel family protein [Sphingomonas sp. MA1305]|uniref:potassium channel family protein n=1 Tax=Sphingomonas sp. MA1305 TaxID=2479204 RepID=UPI0018DFFB9C|nr:potassium channel family protein [Sphingomonas sp. MA1305]MBI0475606.1 two pore domain potassium channel family protein [Sphingomonas sp. MA1305]
MTVGQGVGAALMLLFLADVFLTVLYARAGTGLLAPHWNRGIWALLRGVSKLAGRRDSTVLTFAGSLIVVSLIGFWAIGLVLGAALIIRPELGTAIRPSSGASSTDFATALLVAGNSLSIVGGGDYSPHTTGARLFFLLNSLIGTSVLSLVLSYLVQVYSALRERNALALAIDLMSDGTGDAAVMLVRLMPRGKAGDATSELGNLARSLAATKEAHHFYPLLFYFRFEQPLYAVSRFSFVLLDAMTLIDTALDQDRYGAVSASAPVAAIRRGARLLLETLDSHFPTGSARNDPSAEAWQFRQSYNAATRILAEAEIATSPNGAKAYVAARSDWELLVRRVAPTLGYSMPEIDRRAEIVAS